MPQGTSMKQHSISVQLEGERSPVARPVWLLPLGVTAFVMLGAAQLFGILVSPPDRDMGNLEKIMYVHVPAAWMAFLCFFVVFVESVRYLLGRGRQERHDLMAAAAAETGAVLTALTLTLGSIWGRPTWGVWWTWDARLTSTALLLALFLGYLALRRIPAAGDVRSKRAAVAALF